jgi:hypothetical protein
LFTCLIAVYKSFTVSVSEVNITSRILPTKHIQTLLIRMSITSSSLLETRNVSHVENFNITFTRLIQQCIARLGTYPDEM